MKEEIAMHTKKDTKYLLKHENHLRYILVAEGILVGIAAGCLSVLFRFILGQANTALLFVLDFVKGNWLGILGWFVILLLMALIVGQLVKWQPLSSGSGIPQVEGEITGQINQCWWKIIIAKVVGGTLCLFGGLSLGREGPSIQLGAMAGKGLSKLFKRDKHEENFLITCGAGAGLAAAFNAPLAGVMFSLEEIHKNFSVSALVSAMTASVTADIISKYVFGLAPVFHFQAMQIFPLNSYWIIILLGILLGVFGAIYNFVMTGTQTLYKKMKWIKPQFRLIIPFLLAGVLGCTMPQVLGGGHNMVDALISGQLLLPMILILFLIKFLFSAVSFGSGAPGGIFFPILVLGAYLGGAYGLIVTQWLGLNSSLINNFIILAMAGFLTAIVRAPITGIILISEMTGSFTHLLSLAVVSITAYVVAYLLRSTPIYETLLERILSQQKQTAKPKPTGKILAETQIQNGSFLANKTVSQVNWPEGCLLVSIRRGEKELLPNGQTVLLVGDVLISLQSKSKYVTITQQLSAYCLGK